jgi:hypothetical protein
VLSALPPASGSSLFSAAEREELGSWLCPGSLSVGSGVEYERGLVLWNEWRCQLPEDQRPDEYLRDVADADEKALCLVKFARYLYKPPRNWRGAQVTSLFTHLRHYFFNVVASVSFFDGDIMGKARKAVARNAEEARAHMEKVAKTCLPPLCLAMTDGARRDL